jgi:hypothetical protein
VCDHGERRVQRCEARLGGDGFATPDLLRAEQDLPLQVRQLDAVMVHEADGADARCGEIQRGR